MSREQASFHHFQKEGKSKDSGFYCSHSERAITDLVTNATLFPQVELKTLLGAFIHSNELPESWLPSLLHESVHHWCFSTPVGTAIAVLEARARLRILLSAFGDLEDDQESSEDEQKAIEDLTRFQIVNKLLHPLAEGLALFAEFDVEPRPETKVISRPMKFVYGYFTNPSKDEIASEWGKSLLILLRKQRLTQRFIDRKSNILLEPLGFHDSGQNGYLLGYLMVKNLWHLACRRTPRFYDADLFYTFLQRYIYSDYAFVQVLLQNSTQGPSAADSIASYLHSRLDQIGYLDLDYEADKVDRTQDLASSDPDAIFAPIASNLEQFEEGQKLLNQALEFISANNHHEKLDFVRRLMSRLFGQRFFLSLGKFDIQISPTTPGCLSVSLDEMPDLFEGKHFDDWIPAKTEGQLNIFFSLYGSYPICAVSVGSRVIAVKYPDTVEEITNNEVFVVFEEGQQKTVNLSGIVGNSIREQISYLLTDQENLIDLNNGTQSAREIFVELSGFGDRFDKVQSITCDIVDKIYKAHAFGWADKERIDECYSQIYDKGLSSILDDDWILVNAVAALSLAASVGLSEEEARKHLPMSEISVGEALDKFEEIAQKTGFPLVHRTSNGFMKSFV